jgi:hypothetical protein
VCVRVCYWALWVRVWGTSRSVMLSTTPPPRTHAGGRSGAAAVRVRGRVRVQLDVTAHARDGDREHLPLGEARDPTQITDAEQTTTSTLTDAYPGPKPQTLTNPIREQNPLPHGVTGVYAVAATSTRAQEVSALQSEERGRRAGDACSSGPGSVWVGVCAFVRVRE